MAAAPTVPGLLHSLQALFYISSIFGVVPYSLWAFLKRHVLQLSIVGNVYVVCSLVVYTGLYHVATTNYVDGDWEKTLTNAIGIFIIYMEPLMMCTDMLAAMINQKRFIECFDRLGRVDGKLASVGILLDNRRAKRTSIFLLLAMLLFESIITVYSFISFETVYSPWSMIWFVTTIPTALNSVSRIWYVTLVLAVRHRFNAMNAHMNAIAQGILHFKEQYGGEPESVGADIPLDYLEREIFTVYTQRKKQLLAGTPPKKRTQQPTPKIITVKPYEGKPLTLAEPIKPDGGLLHGSAVVLAPGAAKPGDTFGPAQEYLPTDLRQRPRIGPRMDNKLILICRTHDELCEIGKIINRMYSVQMLIAMAHGFVTITAQFYFLYCGLTGQDVPVLFRFAEVLLLSVASILYTALKCVVPIFVCWKTKTDSQRTGIEMHYLANVVDECHCYEVVNHLSLKLLNHHLNFSACGFFDLDMTTLYAITGAITSYLIILIQFNLAAIQKSSTNSTAISNVTSTALSLVEEVSTAISTYVAN
ncbi:gustatory receptor for bitter taste 66a [Anopheles ziemanni]|uniref:gustatory receptor for bitter taste 66a n=1 Tax=Anopheles coustani TaxID=139045 RepID=UPI002657CA49|nr:gustatory receptor for bitter taste 66a [Anopheles coustani]XP_058169566.1 gustatory receptor for bitter taste 66a [Anopheles ziemanni]